MKSLARPRNKYKNRERVSDPRQGPNNSRPIKAETAAWPRCKPHFQPGYILAAKISQKLEIIAKVGKAINLTELRDEQIDVNKHAKSRMSRALNRNRPINASQSI
ncbi:hypothetical protein CFIMG_004626RA [Ceratocystis fimbriata CBS 114723]|uniref:Uncharacterized protein n=1 Tax=Ceratocystis fimbriata CBS 114723 TaxID=1035309 RepID=A0A2C5X1N1_9PEZI|nr:hypothetical protein CFIMG_004626RA [Ceratocystis fimbriata CBS 114723]